MSQDRDCYKKNQAAPIQKRGQCFQLQYLEALEKY